jgi:ubiquinone/menaquinone biosynthesis C-methylase UbiE
MEGNMAFNNILDYMSLILADNFKEGGFAVDATCGNGHDTLFLSNIAGESGRVYSIDIQKEALERSRLLIKESGRYDNVTFFNISHDKIDSIVDGNPDCIVFNLGFLPGGDKSITTVSEVTLSAVEKGLRILTKGGLLLIAVYHGHPNGMIEKEAVLEFTKSLNQKMYNCSKIEFVNQINNPPILYIIEKRQ